MSSSNKKRKILLPKFSLVSPLKLLPIDGMRHEMWYELFYDLILVTGVYNLGHLLAMGDDVDFVKGLVVFLYTIGLTGTWLNFQEYVNRFNSFDLLHLVYFIAHLISAMIYVAYLQGPHHALSCPTNTTDTLNTDSGHHRRLLSDSSGSSDIPYSSHNVLRDQSGLVFGYAAMQFMLSVKYARVAYVIVEYRQQAICKSLGAFLDSLLWICSLPVNHTTTAVYMYVIGIVLDQSCQFFALSKFKCLPYHVHHFTTRCTLLFLIFSGEIVLQLGILPRHYGPTTWYKLSLLFVFLTIMMFAVQYAYLSLHEGRHVLDDPKSWKCFVWIKLHQLIALAVLIACVGLAKIFEDIYTFDPDSHKDYKALMFASGGLCVTQVGLTTLRALTKGCPRKRCYSRRTLAYIWRYFNALNYLVVLAIFYSKDISMKVRGTPLVFFILMFLVAFLSTLTDLLNPSKQDHHSHQHHLHEDASTEVMPDGGSPKSVAFKLGVVPDL